MADLYLARLDRLERALAPLGFVDGKYGELYYDVVAWNGTIDSIDFGFNIFVDGRLIASAAFYHDGREEIDLDLHRWLTQETPMVPPTDINREDPQYKRMELWAESDARL